LNRRRIIGHTIATSTEVAHVEIFHEVVC
jgi:hypothetical protein